MKESQGRFSLGSKYRMVKSFITLLSHSTNSPQQMHHYLPTALYTDSIMRSVQKQNTLPQNGSMQVPRNHQLVLIMTVRSLIGDWIEMIAMENWTLSADKKPLCCEKLRHHNKFSIKKVSSVFLPMTLPIENIIAAKMKSTGYMIIIHDGWTKFGTSYFGVTATYISEKKVES